MKDAVHGKSNVQKPFVGIIGLRNSGKSTVIRTLTGCRANTFRGIVTDKATSEQVYVVCSSPQEQPMTLADFKKTLKSCANDPRCRGVVVAIQPTRPTSRISMEDIYQEVAMHGAFRAHAFVLDPDWSGSTGHHSSIAIRLAPFSVKPLAIDARRFPYVNAQIVNRKTRIIC